VAVAAEVAAEAEVEDEVVVVFVEMESSRQEKSVM
jgi:hypothetical protein